jgi:hypothetical protein
MEMARCSICGDEHPVATMVIGHKRPEDVPDDVRPGFPEPSDFWLADADELHGRHPRSYFIPPADRRRALRPGELVRLEFTYGPHADREGEGHVERMWVEVLEQRDDGHARGRLRNHPRRLTELAIGDLVAFEPENVITIDYTDDELGYPQDQWPIVDQAVLRDDRAPDIVVRAQDEWWLICRKDAAGPTSDSVNSLTDRFPGLLEPLRAGEGLWELAGGERADARWRRVSDEEVEASEEWRGLLSSLVEMAEHIRRS